MLKQKYFLWLLVGVFILALTLFPNPKVLATDSGTFIDTTTSYLGWANCYNYQIKNFYANGRLWTFYADGNNMVYKTSLDGITWSAKTVFYSGQYCGYALALHFDGMYLHYAFNGAYTGALLMYRMGIPNSNGTITWVNSEQIVLNVATNYNSMYCQIITDSNGYPWIVYCYKATTFPTIPAVGYVTKSSTKDGTWTTASGFPYNLTGNHVSNLPIPHMTALTNGKMYFVYNSDSNSLPNYGVLWNGSWGSIETTTHINSGYNPGQLIADGDNVYYIYMSAESNLQWYVRERTYGVGWGAAVFIVNGGGAGLTISETLIEPNHLIFIGADSNNSFIKYWDYNNGVLGSVVNWIDETAEGFPYPVNNNALLTSNPLCSTALTYVTKMASPYNIKFAKLTLGGANPPPPPPPPTDETCYGVQSSGYDVYLYNLTTQAKSLIAHVATLQEAYALINSLKGR